MFEIFCISDSGYMMSKEYQDNIDIGVSIAHSNTCEPVGQHNTKGTLSITVFD